MSLKFKQITSKEYYEHKGLVYDITVDKSHSYNINDLVVHNSGGGSLVAYATDITKIDPLEYQLIFERFLNPERGKLPDIDSDFCFKRSNEVFKYLIEKYGKEYCCNIATFGRLKLKAVIKDISKAVGVPFEEANEFTKMIPKKIGEKEIKHVEDLELVPELKPFFLKHPDIIEHAKKLEGSPRHVSQHAAGICISPIPVTDLLPVQNAKSVAKDDDDDNVDTSGLDEAVHEVIKQGYLSQYEKEQTEAVGLVKLDVLRLKNVTEIHEQLQLVEKYHGLKMRDVDIPLDDQKTWDLIGTGDTLGIFQMASNVAIPIIKKVKPQNIEELSAINAFIRPGASGLDEYLAGKKNIDNMRKLDPRIDRHLLMTYGAIVYQEQIMFLISELLGISFGQADLYRRALEKPDKGKNVKVVAEFKEKSVTVGVERGFKKEVCELVRDLIIDNSGYGFNKSHSIAYAIISYWTAWIKANYPLIFYTAMLNGHLEQLSDFMAEAKKHGITILPPHVNYSKYDTVIEDEKNKVIRIGFNAVKGVGPAAVESITSTQPYTSIDDFFERNNMRSVNKKVIEALIKVGAFEGVGIAIEEEDVYETFFNEEETVMFRAKMDDKLNIKDGKAHLNRNQLLAWYGYYSIIASVKSIPNYAVPKDFIKGKFLEKYELAFEDDNTIIIPEIKLTDFELKLEDVEQYKSRKKPKAFLKLAVEEHKKVPPSRKVFINYKQEISQIPVDSKQDYLNEVNEFGYSFISHPLEIYAQKINLFGDVKDGEKLMTCGMVTGIEERKTKKGKSFYWVHVQTPRDNVRLTLWSEQYKKFKEVVAVHNLIKVRGMKGFGGMNVDDLAKINPASIPQ